MKEIEKCLKVVYKSRKLIEGISTDVNPVFLEEQLPHANEMLLDMEHMLSKGERLEENTNDLLNQYLKIHEEMSGNNEKCD